MTTLPVPQQRRRGHPLHITPDLMATVQIALRTGSFRSTAAIYAGITRQTFHRWITRAEEILDQREAPDFQPSEPLPRPRRRADLPAWRKAETERQRRQEEEDLYVDFFYAVQDAEASAEVSLEASIFASDDWRAKAWLLERRFSKRWGLPRQERTRDKEEEDPDENLAIRMGREIQAAAGVNIWDMSSVIYHDRVERARLAQGLEAGE